MNKFLRYLFLLGVAVTIPTVSIYSQEESAPEEETDEETSESVEEEKPVVQKKSTLNVRMMFVGGDESTRGIVFNSENSIISPDVNTLVSPEVDEVVGYQTIKFDEYEKILAPLIRGNTITITKNNIDACKNNLKNPDSFAKITNELGEKKEEVQKKLLNALETFYKTIKNNFLTSSSGIDFSSLPSTESSQPQKAASGAAGAVSGNQYANLNQFFTQVLGQDMDEEQFASFLMANYLRAPQGTRNYINIEGKPKFTKQNLIQQWRQIMLTPSKECPPSLASISAMPFVDIYERNNAITAPLRTVYAALQELGNTFKFKMELKDPETFPQRITRSKNYASIVWKFLFAKRPALQKTVPQKRAPQKKAPALQTVTKQ